MITVFDALHQTEDFVNEITTGWKPRQIRIFNMFLMSQIINSGALRDFKEEP